MTAVCVLEEINTTCRVRSEFSYSRLKRDWYYLSYFIIVILRKQQQWDQAFQDVVLHTLLICVFHSLYGGSKESHGQTMDAVSHLRMEDSQGNSSASMLRLAYENSGESGTSVSTWSYLAAWRNQLYREIARPVFDTLVSELYKQQIGSFIGC